MVVVKSNIFTNHHIRAVWMFRQLHDLSRSSFISKSHDLSERNPNRIRVNSKKKDNWNVNVLKHDNLIYIDICKFILLSTIIPIKPATLAIPNTYLYVEQVFSHPINQMPSQGQ
jgi:hypothetical protein